MKTPEQYATELLARKGKITEFLLAHTITMAMRDTRDACARMVDEEAMAYPEMTPGLQHAAHILRSEMIIGGPIRATLDPEDKMEEEVEA